MPATGALFRRSIEVELALRMRKNHRAHIATFRHDTEDSTSLSNDSIRSIHEAEDGMLWIATYGGGMNRLDPNLLAGSFHLSGCALPLK